MNRRHFLTSAVTAGVAGAIAAATAPVAAEAVERSRDIRTIRNYAPKMRYRTFGKTGEKVSVLGFGTMRLPVVNGNYADIDIPAATRLVRHAIDCGVNYLDTSWSYHGDMFTGGSSEPFVGQILTQVGRDRVYLASKLPIWAVESRKDMDTILNAQLKRLCTDHIDFYLVHSIRQKMWDKVVALGLQDFLDKALKSGKIRYAGFSFHDIPDTWQQVIDFYDWSFCQHVCNYYDVTFQAGMYGIRQAALRDYGFVAMEPLLGGVLANQLPKEALDVLAATGIERSQAGWALRWVWDQPEVSLLLSGMGTMEQLNENLAIAELSDVPMTLDERTAMDRVRAILKAKGPIPCTGCGKCSCPKGVGIQMCFECFNANTTFTLSSIGHHNYGQSIKPTARAAHNCDGCGSCLPMCPEHLNIPAELKKVADYFADAVDSWG